MASFVTNRGMFLILAMAFRNTDESLYLVLLTNDTPPTVDANTLADVSEMAAGNGYTSGGQAITRNSTDFDSLVEDDTGDSATILIKDIAWTASGGTLPASGNSPAYWGLTTGEVTVSARQLIAYGDITPTGAVVSAGQAFTVPDAGVKLSKP